MSCNYPKRAFQSHPGGPVSFSQSGYRPGCRIFQIPCGRCRGCRLERSRQDAVRCVHEAQMHGDENSFITLTYAEDRLSLCKEDWVKFMKRLREKVAPVLIRFFACGEYGDLHGRPHYHAVIFGYSFPDKVLWKKSPSGEPLYRSALLESVWSLGHSSVGSFSFESAAYVARYVMKKQIGGKDPVRRIFDVVSGEMVSREHEFGLRSLRPGLGRRWFDRFGCDVYPHDLVVINGARAKPPRYYDKLFASSSPEAFAAIVGRRQAAADESFDDNSPSRLRVKEVVLKARISHLKRTL